MIIMYISHDGYGNLLEICLVGFIDTLLVKK